MHVATLLLRAILVVVFGSAGAAKLADLRAARATIIAFGLPPRAADIGGKVLPFVELSCAVALLFQETARWGALGCLILLLTFSGGVAYALSQGRTPECNCFGQVSSAQVSWRTLVRNAVFITVSVIVIGAAPGASFSGWTSNPTVAALLASAAVLAGAFLGVVLLRYQGMVRDLRSALSQARRHMHDEGLLRVGADAPGFELRSLSDETITLDGLCARRLPVILVFASQACAPCAALLPEIARWTGALSDRLTIAVLESGVGDRAALRADVESVGDILVITEEARAVAESFGVTATPTGIAVDPDGRLAARPAMGGGAIEELIRSALRTTESALTAVA